MGNKMKIEHFSEKYKVRLITDEDVKEVFELCRENPTYYEYCPPFVTEDSIRRDMKALPRGKGMEDKYYIGFFEAEKLIAVMDFIDAYPAQGKAFIGFFMTAASVQRKGVGSEIISGLCDYLRGQQYEEIRLGWVKGNRQSESFWHKNHFAETGAAYDTDGYTVIVAARKLQPCAF